MEPYLKFMENNPWLTFFIVLLTLQAIVAVIQAIANRNKPKCQCAISLGHDDDNSFMNG